MLLKAAHSSRKCFLGPKWRNQTRFMDLSWRIHK